MVQARPRQTLQETTASSSMAIRYEPVPPQSSQVGFGLFSREASDSTEEPLRVELLLLERGILTIERGIQTTKEASFLKGLGQIDSIFCKMAN